VRNGVLFTLVAKAEGGEENPDFIHHENTKPSRWNGIGEKGKERGGFRINFPCAREVASKIFSQQQGRGPTSRARL